MQHVTKTQSNKIKKPISAKSINIMLTIVATFSLLLVVFEVTSAILIRNDQGTVSADGNVNISGTLMAILATFMIILSLVYLILVIVCFAMGIRFRRQGGGKAVVSLTTVAFVFGILHSTMMVVVILIFAIRLALIVVTFGIILLGDKAAWDSFAKGISTAMFVGVVVLGISFLAMFTSTIIGWKSLKRQPKVTAHAN